MKSVAVIVAATVFLIVLAARAQERTPRPHDTEWSAPASQRARTNPLINQPDAAAGGRKIFHERCSGCHGEDARGSSRAPDLTGSYVQEQSDGELFWKITSGNTRTGMPTFSYLPELQRWQVVLHLRAHAEQDRR